MSDEEPAVKTPKITIREKPSEAHIRAAMREHVVTDVRGRRIRLARPSALAEYKLNLVVGGEAAANRTYMQMLQPLLFVTAINDDPVFFPAKPVEVDALIQRLDEDGIAAVVKGIVDHFARADLAADQDATKN